MSQWEISEFQSGTIIVHRPGGGPYYYVHGSRFTEQDDRYGVAVELRDYLNGDQPRPVWIDNAFRETETKLVHEDGYPITATGPIILRPGSDPKALDWIEDPSRAARDARARLIDNLQMEGSDA